MTTVHGIAQHPDFVESLRLLIEREQYSLTDIALMYNVSRERIRQLCVRYELTPAPYARGLYAVRVWDDTQHRFVPVPRGAYVAGERQQQAQQFYAQQAAQRAQRRARLCACFQHLHQTLGRTPTLQEWATAARGRPVQQHAAAPYLIATWGHDGGERTRMAQLYAAVGSTPRSRGGARTQRRSR